MCFFFLQINMNASDCCFFPLDLLLFLDITYAKNMGFPSGICLSHRKQRNVLFCWTLKPTKRFKIFLLFWAWRRDAARTFFAYVIKRKENLVKKDRTLFNKPKQMQNFRAVLAMFNFGQKSVTPFFRQTFKLLQQTTGGAENFVSLTDATGVPRCHCTGFWRSVGWETESSVWK